MVKRVLTALGCLAIMGSMLTVARADNPGPGVYTVATPGGNWTVTYTKFPNGMATFTLGKSGQVSSSYRVSTTGAYWEMKYNGTTICVVTTPNGPGDPLITSSDCSFYRSEAVANPALWTSPCMSTARSTATRDRYIFTAMANVVPDANFVYAGYVIAYGETQRRAVSNELSMSGYYVIAIPGGGTPQSNDTSFATCITNCEFANLWGCSAEAMCVMGCEAYHSQRAVEWRAECGYSSQQPYGVLGPTDN